MASEPDGATPSNQADAEPEVAEHPNQPPATGLGSAYHILRVFFGDAISNGPLGPDTVPSAALTIPIAVATDTLVRHAKRCRDPHHCSTFPPLLHRYHLMRPDTIRKAKEEVHKALWTHPNHKLVMEVRKSILDEHSDLAEEISKGHLQKADRLEELLSESGPAIIAAVLWSSEFEGPDAELLFRILVSLTPNKPSSSNEKAIAGGQDQDLQPLKSDLRKTKRALKQSKGTATKAEQALRQKERALSRHKRDFESLQRKSEQLIDQLDSARRQLLETKAAHRSLELDAQRAAKANSNLRKELRQLQIAQRELEARRSDLALQLATERSRVAQLKLQLTDAPLGSDTVWDFLREEKEQIQTRRTINSGGAKERANEEWRTYRKLERAFLDAYPEYQRPRPVTIRPRSSLQLVALGGSEEIGRSCYLLELGDKRILVDCGIKPSDSKDLHPDIDLLERLDALILTHAHTDHIGWVPALVRQFPTLDIYCSEGTAALLPVMLEDCYHHYVRKATVLRERAQYMSNAEPVVEAYDAEDVHTVSKRAFKCNFEKEEVLFGDVSIRFYCAGHILGAASVLVEDQSGRKIFFSGDFSSFPQLTVPAASWPSELGDVDLLVLESTYGGREKHNSIDDSRADLISFMRETLEKGEGSVILASFGLGRAQELLKLVATAQQEGDLVDVPDVVCG